MSAEMAVPLTSGLHTYLIKLSAAIAIPTARSHTGIF